MADKKQPKRLATQVGTAIYPKVNNVVDVYDGKEVGYTVQMVFDDKYTEELKAMLQAELDAAKASDDWKGKKYQADPSLGFKPEMDKEGNETGRTLFKFHTKHEYKDKEGNIVRKIVPIFDAKNKPIDVNLGHGSKVKINFTPGAFHLHAKNYGVTLYLNAIQVIELVEFGDGRDGSAFGFGEEDGYSVPADENFGSDEPEFS